MKSSLAWLSFLVLVITLAGYRNVWAQSPGQAGLVIDYGEGRIETYCIDLEQDTSNGIDVLMSAGLALETNYTSQGAAVCKINHAGCPADNCFCDSPPNYWSYWHLEKNQWVYARSGAITYLIQPGQVDGWAWGDGSPPQLTSLDQICSNQTVTLEQSPLPKEAKPVSQLMQTGIPTNYWVFGILAVGLTISLAWILFRR